MNQQYFESICGEIAKSVSYQGEAYAQHHMTRLFRLYSCCIGQNIGKESSILSLGGGSAYVEAVLAKTVGAKATILDFQEVISANQSHYAKHDMIGVPGNLLDPFPACIESNGYDFVIAAEILEHIPLPPRDFFLKIAPRLNPGGKLVISTPNLASAKTILNLIRHKPIMPKSELFFSETSAENEGVHRREYLRSELESSAKAAGLSVLEFHFINKGPARDRSGKLANCLSYVLPRFRPLMLAVLSRPA